MKAPNNLPAKDLKELIDRIEQIREELLTIQLAMEKFEPRAPRDPTKES